jgi:hypothetical protein
MKKRTRNKSLKVVTVILVTQRQNYSARSDESVNMPAQPCYVQVDMPSIFDETRTNIQVLPSRSLLPEGGVLSASDACDQYKTVRKWTTRLWQRH